MPASDHRRTGGPPARRIHLGTDPAHHRRPSLQTPNTRRHLSTPLLVLPCSAAPVRSGPVRSGPLCSAPLRSAVSCTRRARPASSASAFAACHHVSLPCCPPPPVSAVHHGIQLSTEILGGKLLRGLLRGLLPPP